MRRRVPTSPFSPPRSVNQFGLSCEARRCSTTRITKSVGKPHALTSQTKLRSPFRKRENAKGPGALSDLACIRPMLPSSLILLSPIIHKITSYYVQVFTNPTTYNQPNSKNEAPSPPYIPHRPSIRLSLPQHRHPCSRQMYLRHTLPDRWTGVRSNSGQQALSQCVRLQTRLLRWHRWH